MKDLDLEIRKKLEKEAIECLNAESANNYKTIYQSCRDNQARIIEYNDNHYIILGAVSSWDPHGENLYYLALNVDKEIKLIPVNETILDVGNIRISIEPYGNYEGPFNSLVAKEYWIYEEYDEGAHDQEIIDIVRNYLKENPTNYMFTTIMLPNKDYSVTTPYEDNYRLPHIYLELERDTTIEEQCLVINFLEPAKYPKDNSDSRLLSYMYESLCYLSNENKTKQLLKNLESTKSEKYYLLSEKDMDEIKDFCECGCLLVGTDCCKS